MSATISILAALALGILLILLLPWFLARLATSSARPVNQTRRFCDWLCRIRIMLGFLLGLALGVFFCVCYSAIIGLLQSGPACLTSLFWLLLLALFAAIWLVYRLIECWRTHRDPTGGTTTSGMNPFQTSLYLLLVILALLVFWLLVRATGLPLRELLFVALCGRLLLAAIFVAIVFLIVRALELRYCGVKPDFTTGHI